jgi:putative ABC transport system substrate-binding protein
LAYASDIVVIKKDIQVYNEVTAGLRSECGYSVKTYEPDGVNIEEIIKRDAPSASVAVGVSALKHAASQKATAVMFTLVLSHRQYLEPNEHVTGVSMHIPADYQLDVIRKTLPGVENIGIIHDPQKTGHLIAELKQKAGDKGINIHAVPIGRPPEAVRALEKLKSKIDLLWMFPDTTAINTTNVEYMLLYSYQNNIPIYAPSERFLKQGALVSLSLDAFDIGRQACGLAKEILSGNRPSDIPVIAPRTGNLGINLKAARKLGIRIPEDVIREAQRTIK